MRLRRTLSRVYHVHITVYQVTQILRHGDQRHAIGEAIETTTWNPRGWPYRLGPSPGQLLEISRGEPMSGATCHGACELLMVRQSPYPDAQVYITARAIMVSRDTRGPAPSYYTSAPDPLNGLVWPESALRLP